MPAGEVAGAPDVLLADDDGTVAATFGRKDSAQAQQKRNRGDRAKGPLSCSATKGDGNQEAGAVKMMAGQKFTRKGDRPLEDGIMADSCAHRKLGLWAIDSVNGNSWSGGSQYLEFTSHFDTLLL